MMAYSNRFVVSVLINGKVQKELGDNTVELPFDTEYTLRFRNKHRNRRAVVKLFIDGEEQSNNGYVIPPSGYVDIERNSHSPHKFLFVSPESTEAQDFGKDPQNKERLNGVIEARFYLEKEQPPVQEVHHHHYPKPNPWYRRDKLHEHHHHHHHDGWKHTCGDAEPASGAPDITCSNTPSGTKGIRMGDTGIPKEIKLDNTNIPTEIHFCDSGIETTSENMEGDALFEAAPRHAKRCRSKKEVTPGVTVEGGYSTQRFRTCNVDVEDQCTVVKVFMRGHENTQEVVEENSGGTDDGTYCPNCGAKIKGSKANFCSVCGHKF